MKSNLLILALIIFCLCINVKANIICNDGTESETCVDCHQGCCSGHDGCLKDNNNNLNYIAVGTGAVGIIGAAAYTGYKIGKRKK